MAEFEDFYKRLVAVEKRTNAIGAKFNGIQLYPLLRVRIFYAIATSLGIFDDPHPSKASEKPKTSPKLEFENLPQTPIVVLPFRRLVGSADPYSDRIIELLGSVGSQLPGAGSAISVLPFEGDQPNAITYDNLRTWSNQQFKPGRLETYQNRFAAKANANRWQKIMAAFESEFGVVPEFAKDFPPAALRQARREAQGFARYFKAIGAKHLYIVNAYSNWGIVLGAKRAGVKVHEIQHGFISAMHPAYAYEGSPKISHAPDTLLTWGSYWTDQVPLPAGTSTLVTGPTASFIEYRDRVAKTNRIVKNQVLFTSQGAVATQLLTAALQTAKSRKDLHVIYRLHPNENLADYEALATSIEGKTAGEHGSTTGGKKLPKNFEFSHKQPIFLDLVSQSEFLVGAFSTTLYEGLALGCKVLVLPLAGFEHVNRAIALGDMTLVGNLEELPNSLSNAKPAADARRYYA